MLNLNVIVQEPDDHIKSLTKEMGITWVLTQLHSNQGLMQEIFRRNHDFGSELHRRFLKAAKGKKYIYRIKTVRGTFIIAGRKGKCTIISKGKIGFTGRLHEDSFRVISIKRIK